MRHDEGPPLVDFVVTDADGSVGEDLPQPPERPALRRARLPLLIAGVAALVAIVVVAGLSDSRTGSPQARATTTVSPTPVAASGSVAGTPSAVVSPLPEADGRRIQLAFSGCPPSALCAIDNSTPATVHRALRARFPDVRSVRSVTLTDARSADPRLLFRRVTARSGNSKITLTVRPVADKDRGGGQVRDTAAAVVVVINARTKGFFVTVRLAAPSGSNPSLVQPQRLAVDGRVPAVQ